MSSRLQQKLWNEFFKHYPTAQVKKLGADNFLDIHLPFIHEKRGTHLFFNTSGDKIKLGFYCREEEFTSRVLSGSTILEAYSQGVRLAGNPAFNTVEEVIKAAQDLISALGSPAGASSQSTTPASSEGASPSTTPIAETLEPTSDSSDQEEDDEQEDDDSRGYPFLMVPRSETVSNDVVKKYLMRWQVPSVEYNGRAGITCYYPDWVEKLTLDEICPLFTNDQIKSIASKVEDEKIIPVLSYAPEELHEELKRVWWIVPFCIWKEEVASMVVVDKNGLHALYKDDDEVIFSQIFGWEHVYHVEYEEEYSSDIMEDDPNVCRLTLYMEDSSRYLTFDEFISHDGKRDQGSYLAVLYAIWSARAKTIEASRGKPVWYEGAGGEGFKDMPTPQSLLDVDSWRDPSRPDPVAFGLGEYDEDEDEEMEDSGNAESDSNSSSGSEEIRASDFSIPEILAFLYIACAGVDGKISGDEKEVMIKELNGWSQTGQLLPAERMVELVGLWANLSKEDERNLVIALANQLKLKFDDEKLKTVFADLVKIANTLDGISEDEKEYIVSLATIWRLS
jgi:hypothetical protein